MSLPPGPTSRGSDLAAVYRHVVRRHQFLERFDLPLAAWKCQKKVEQLDAAIADPTVPYPDGVAMKQDKDPLLFPPTLRDGELDCGELLCRIFNKGAPIPGTVAVIDYRKVFSTEPSHDAVQARLEFWESFATYCRTLRPPHNHEASVIRCIYFGYLANALAATFDPNSDGVERGGPRDCFTGQCDITPLDMARFAGFCLGEPETRHDAKALRTAISVFVVARDACAEKEREYESRIKRITRKHNVDTAPNTWERRRREYREMKTYCDHRIGQCHQSILHPPAAGTA